MHSNGLYTRFLPDEEATLKLGEEWSKQLSAPLTIYLEGGLGAGKTTLTRGILRGLGIRAQSKARLTPLSNLIRWIHSPSTISTSPLYHARGMGRCRFGRIVCARQHLPHRMAAAGGEFTPPADITITLTYTDKGRTCTFSAHTNQGRKSLESWSN